VSELHWVKDEMARSGGEILTYSHSILCDKFRLTFLGNISNKISMFMAPWLHGSLIFGKFSVFLAKQCFNLHFDKVWGSFYSVSWNINEWLHSPKQDKTWPRTSQWSPLCCITALTF